MRERSGRERERERERRREREGVRDADRLSHGETDIERHGEG